MYLSGKACPLFKVYTEETEPDCTAGTPPGRLIQKEKQAVPPGAV